MSETTALLCTRGSRGPEAAENSNLKLLAARHVRFDLPREINHFVAGNTAIDVRLGRDLGTDPKLLRAMNDAGTSQAGQHHDVRGIGTDDLHYNHHHHHR